MVKKNDVQRAVEILQNEYLQTTALASHDLSTADVVFDEQAALTTCPACSAQFSPTSSTCPECGLSFG